ncbi:MAG: NlpC/P60 family protein [Gammaproteobacteria bacterium]
MKNLFPLIFIFGLLTSLLTGCGSLPTHHRTSHASRHTDQPVTFSSQQQAALYKRLEAQYRNWKGTPYRLGGMNKNGIDCSGFVHVAFRDGLGMRIPRTTQTLASRGYPIRKRQLKVGDLVFFKTGFGKHHVGIYIGNQQFIHASTSSGVMKSRLDNPYWSDHYWKSVRLISN